MQMAREVGGKSVTEIKHHKNNTTEKSKANVGKQARGKIKREKVDMRQGRLRQQHAI